jgi:transposase InsO family protein
MIYPLVREMAARDYLRTRVPVAVVCRVLKFSEQVYYKWVANSLSDREIEETNLVQELHKLHDEDPEGGYRVLADDLADLGYQVSERRVWRLCRAFGIRSTIARRKRRYDRAGEPVGDDLVQRDFKADPPNKIWLTDITEHWTSEGKLYTCAIKDVFANRIVGYSMSSRMKAQIAVDVLDMAMKHRGYPKGVIIYSDRGSQYRSHKFQKAVTNYEAKGSMGRVGSCGDNAAMESFFSLLQKNILDCKTWRSRQDLRLARLDRGQIPAYRRKRGYRICC